MVIAENRMLREKIEQHKDKSRIGQSESTRILEVQVSNFHNLCKFQSKNLLL